MRLTLETLKRPLRLVKRRLIQQRHDAGAQPTTSIIDVYSKSYPTSQEAINIFQGEWSSLFPAEMNLQAGTVPLFQDDRIQMGLRELGGVAGQTVLELGPLEGGHSYQLEKAGAKSVLAIEANTRAYLKCLIARELLGMQRVRFLCGDFMEYLRQSPPRFDFVLCSGVLYHQKQPVELIHRLSQITDRMLLWTHYYDEAIIRSSPQLSPKFPSLERAEYAGYAHTLHRQEYQLSLAHPGFCGAGAEYSNWMERSELLQAFHHVGFRNVKVLQEDPCFVNGPCLMMAVTR